MNIHYFYFQTDEMDESHGEKMFSGNCHDHTTKPVCDHCQKGMFMCQRLEQRRQRMSD